MSKVTDNKYILLIDAGGSSSNAIVLDSCGNIYSSSRGGPINLTQNSRSTIESNLTELYTQALSGNDLGLAELNYIFLGVSGWFSANWDEGKSLIEELLTRDGFTGDLKIYHDSITTWAGATGERSPSVVLYSGTGSFAFGQNSKYERAYADIMGPLLGDSGSGYWIGLKALREAVKSCEGRGKQTQLEQLLKKKFNTLNLDEIVRVVWKDDLSRKEIASMVPRVGKIARNGDKIAGDIFDKAAARLAASVKSAIDQLTDTPEERSDFSLYYSGGVFNVGDVLLDPLTSYIDKYLPELVLQQGEYGPFAGALILGCNEVGISLSEKSLDYVDSCP